MRLFSARLLVLALLQSAGSLSASDDAQTWLQQARRHLKNQEWESAQKAALKTLEIDPRLLEAEILLGLIATARAEYQEAEKRFLKVHRANPSDIPTLMRLLESQLLLKRKPAALLSFRKLKGLLEPRDPRLFEVATMLAYYGDYASAIPLMERFRQLFPQSYDVNYNVALAYFRSENYEKAAEISQALVHQAPRAEAYNLLALAEEQRHRYLEAVRAFQRAAELEPGNEDYRFDYANELLQHRTNQEAILIFASGVRDFPNSWKMRLGLGCAYYLVGKYDEAVQALLKAIRIEPKLKLAYFFLGKVYESAESSQAAIRETFKAYLDQGPDDPWAYYYYGNMLYLQAWLDPRPDFQPARSNLHKALALNPVFAEAHLQLGMIAQVEGRDEESIPFLERAIQSNPKLTAAHYRLGIAYQRLGKKDKAKVEFDLSKRLDSENQAELEKQTVIQFLVDSRK